MAAEPGEQGVLERIVSLGRDLCAAQYGAALLTGPDGAPCALAHQGMSSSQVAALPRLPAPVGLLGVVLAGDVLRLERIDEHLASVGFPAGHVPMTALLGVPLTHDGRVLGGLYLTRGPGAGTFTAEHEQLAQALARQAAIAVDNLRRRGSGQAVLAALGPTAPRSGDHDRPSGGSPVIDRLLSSAHRVLGMDVAFLSQVQDGQQTFTHVQGDTAGLPLTPGTRVDTTDGYCHLMIDEQILSSVPDVPAHPVLGPIAVTAHLGVGGYCGVPVRLPDGTLYGSLCGLNSQPAPAPQPAQLESLKAIAGLLGDALAEQQRAERARSSRAAAFQPMLDGTHRTLVLQPIMDLRRRSPVGFEALSRFTDCHAAPRRPDHVFAEATQLGLGIRLEQAAARDALAVLPDLPPGCYLSVNLSAAALLDPGTYDLLTAAPLHRLVIELTEHEQIADYPALLRALAGLRERGLRLAVDDAGAGFASLQHITRLDPDIIKLDIAFVRDIHLDPSRRAVARAMVAFAGELGASLVAEGIETPHELTQLRALGAQLGQGYHLARPAPPPATRPSRQDRMAPSATTTPATPALPPAKALPDAAAATAATAACEIPAARPAPGCDGPLRQGIEPSPQRPGGDTSPLD